MVFFLKITDDFVERKKKYESEIHKEGKSVHTNRVQTEILEDHYGKARARNFEFFVDEPEVGGGKNRAPRPLEYFLAGFCFCQQVVYSDYIVFDDLNVNNLGIDVKGYVDQRGIFGIDDTEPGFKNLEYTVNIDADEDARTIIDLVDKVEHGCPAHASIRKPIEPSRKIVLNGEEIER